MQQKNRPNFNLTTGNYITLKLGKISVESLVDTGSTVSIINEQVAKRLKLQVRPLNETNTLNLTSANGSDLPIIGTMDLQLYFQGLILPQTVYVSPLLEHSLVLGVDFLSQNRAILNYRLGILSLYEDLVRVRLHSRFDTLNSISVARTICIPAYHEALILANSPKFFNNKTVLLEPLSNVQFNKLAVARALARCQNNTVVCRVLNYNPHVLTLKRGMKIAKVENLKTISSITRFEEPQGRVLETGGNRLSKVELDKFHQDYGFKINPDLTEERRLELLQLLHDHKSVFACSLADLKPCKGYQLQIDVHSQRKMFRRQFRLSEEDKAEATRQILEMERAQIIEPSDTTEFNSAIFLVGKKDGSRRLVVDLRAINTLIVPKLIQLPKIDELLDSIIERKPSFLSVCDIRAAYYQLELSENSRKYTSFCAPDGRRFRYKRVPFGLSTAPSALILVLGNLFADKNKYHSLWIYMDDLLLGNADWKTHLSQLKLTLETLQQNNLSCNPKKTELAYSQVDYLGFKISAEGLQLSEKRVETIKKISAPKNLKGLQRVLGLLNFWRRSISNYAQRTYHMRQLLKKDVPFCWTDECDKELDYLKHCLISNPILRPIDPRRDLICATDGSLTGFGWTWMQRDDNGQLYVISYGAKSTTPAQQRYTADELEAIALVYALKSIEPVAIHKKITVITDNSHLLQWASWKAINARQKRMLAYLMMYSLAVVYVKGSRNVQADYLSRLFQDASEKDRVESRPRHVAEDDDFILAVETRSRKGASLLRPSEPTASEPPPDPPLPVIDTVECSQQVPTTASNTMEPIQSRPVAQDALGPNSEICVDSPEDFRRESSETINTDHLAEVLDITPADYDTDSEFCNIFRYLKTDELSGEDRIDKITLLLADQYVLENGLLYRLEIPKRKRLAQLVPLRKRLCVPLKFRHEVLHFAHDNGGHPATHKLFLTLSARYFWKQLYSDTAEYCKTCGLCQRAKRNYKHRFVPLHPLPVADRPAQKWALDFKPLCRTTKAGNNTILVIVDSFSNWPILIPLPDESAESTAYAFVKYVISVFGVPEEILCDKGSAFVSTFFTKINELLNIKHRTSASRTARSNGLAESCVRALIEQLKLHEDDDLEIEKSLSLIEMRMRATAHSRMELSPYEVMFGRLMPVGTLGEQCVTPFSTGNKQKYYEFLAEEMKRLHVAVKARKEEIKRQDKQCYDKAKRTVTPCWAVGDLVLLHDTRIRPGSNQVITNKRYHGPYVIQQIVCGNDIGQAYKLIRERDGKPLRNLVTSDRLKIYHVDRTELTKRLPRFLKRSPEEQAKPTRTETAEQSRNVKLQRTGANKRKPTSNNTSGRPHFEEALEIIDEQRIGSKKYYLVRFLDHSIHLCDAVSPLLMKMYRSNKLKDQGQG